MQNKVPYMKKQEKNLQLKSRPSCEMAKTQRAHMHLYTCMHVFICLSMYVSLLC